MKNLLLVLTLFLFSSFCGFSQEYTQISGNSYEMVWQKGTAGTPANDKNIDAAQEKVKEWAAAKNSFADITKVESKYMGRAKRPKIFINFKLISNDVKNLNANELYEFLSDLDFGNEKEVRNYLDNNIVDNLEGIYSVSSDVLTGDFLLAVLKIDFTFMAIIIEAACVGCPNFKPGDIKAKITEGAAEGIYSMKWIYPARESRVDDRYTLVTGGGGALLKNSKFSLIKMYPKLNLVNKKPKRTSTEEWEGNGSGIIISKSGYIVTNHHVIENAEDIEVEFILNEEVQKFKAEIVQVDKTNDLAIIKIVDMNFDGLDEPPYNFKTRSSDVGTKIYAFGYPMALSVMGKEIKITDGIISSKSGYDGNITTYQISAPIQGGNSGGPLFDDKGNFLGINSSGLGADVANNVGYTIKSSYVLNLIDVLPKTIDLPSSTKLQSLPLTEQIKEISKYVVLVKVK